MHIKGIAILNWLTNYSYEETSSDQIFAVVSAELNVFMT